MRKKSWIIDISLLVLIIVLGVFLYTQLKENRETIQPENTSMAAEATQTTVEDNGPTDEIVVNYSRQLGQSAPDFTLMDLDGNTVALSDFLGMPVMINFWASWCPPCTAEMPLIDEFAVQYADELVVLAVNVGEQEFDVRAFLNENKFHLMFLLDPSNSVAEKYYVFGYPASMFIDEEGLLQGMHIGELDESKLMAYLREIGVGK